MRQWALCPTTDTPGFDRLKPVDHSFVPMTDIRLLSFPMPPSANRLHVNRSGPGKGRFKSAEYRAYDRDVALWVIRNRKSVGLAAEFTANMTKDQGLHVDYAFCFPHERLFTKDGRLKRLDVDNRLKAAADAVSRVLGFDDSLIIGGAYEKVAMRSKTDAFLSVRIYAKAMTNEISWVQDVIS